MGRFPLFGLLNDKKHLIDLIAVVLFTIIASIAVFVLPDGSTARIILGIPLVLFFPGYALTAALWPESNRSSDQREDRPFEIDSIERVAMGFGLSIVIVALGIYALSASPLGYKRETLVLMLAIVTIFFSVIGWYRRNLLPESERFAVSIYEPVKAFNRFSRIQKTATIMAIVVTVVVLAIIVYLVMSPNETEGYSSYFLYNSNHSISPIPDMAEVNETVSIIIGIVSHEGVVSDYIVTISLTDAANSTQRTLIYTYNTTLSPDQIDERNIVFHIQTAGDYIVEIEFSVNGATPSYLDRLQFNLEII